MTSQEQLEEIEKRVRDLYDAIDNLAIDLTRKYKFRPELTVTSCAEAMLKLLEINTQIYLIRPELAPSYLAGTDWHALAESDRRDKKRFDDFVAMLEKEEKKDKENP